METRLKDMNPELKELQKENSRGYKIDPDAWTWGFLLFTVLYFIIRFLIG